MVTTPILYSYKVASLSIPLDISLAFVTIDQEDHNSFSSCSISGRWWRLTSTKVLYNFILDSPVQCIYLYFSPTGWIMQWLGNRHWQYDDYTELFSSKWVLVVVANWHTPNRLNNFSWCCIVPLPYHQWMLHHGLSSVTFFGSQGNFVSRQINSRWQHELLSIF